MTKPSRPQLTRKKTASRYDRNLSPVGWYVGSFLLSFVETGSGGNNDLDRRSLSWENTIVVRARNLDQAFEKVVKTAKSQTIPYRGGPDGVPVR